MHLKKTVIYELLPPSANDCLDKMKLFYINANTVETHNEFITQTHISFCYFYNKQLAFSITYKVIHANSLEHHLSTPNS